MRALSPWSFAIASLAGAAITHPEGEPDGNGPISFGVESPTPGNPRPFLQFKHADEVHTAAFTQAVEVTP